MTIDLKDYDIVLAIDKSGSMGDTDCPGGVSRWAYAEETTMAIARKAAEFDQDGITLALFSNDCIVIPNTTVDKVKQAFADNEPKMSTDTAGMLKKLFNAYFANPSKPQIIIVITDGVPDDKQAVIDEIVAATQKMESDEQLGVLVVQIGKDEKAKAYLKTLDDDLVEKHGAKFDIVDAKTEEEMGNMSLAELIMQAIED